MPNPNDERPPAAWHENVHRGHTRLLIAAVPLAILALAAGFTYWRQLTTGMGVTGLNRPSYWGLYIVNCVFFVGVSAGGIFIASLVHAFGLKHFESVARIAELMAISCVLMAVMSLFVNLCWPNRMHYILLYANKTSPIFWDMLNVTIYFFISLTYGYFGTRSDLARLIKIKPKAAWFFRLLALGYTDLSARAQKRDQAILKVLSVMGLIGALGMHSVTAWILGLTKARPGWFNAIMAPLFIVSAAVSGLALLIVSVIVTRRLLRLRIEDEVIRRLGQILLFLVPVLCYFLFAEMLTVFYGKEPAEMQVFKVMMHGPYAFLFWGHLLLGLILPVLLLGVVLARVAWRWTAIVGFALLPVVAGIVLVFGFTLPFSEIGGVPVPRWLGYAVLWLIGLILLMVFANERLAEDTRLGIAAGLVVLGIYAERWNIVLPSLVGYSVLPLSQVHYAPSWSEVLLLSGIYSVGGLIYIACVHLLPLVESGEEAEAEPATKPPVRWADESSRWGIQVPPVRQSRWSAWRRW